MQRTVVKRISRIRLVSVREIKKTIEESSMDLDALYRDIFDRIEEKTENEQKLVMWVAYARRPLTFQELASAMAIQEDSKSYASTLEYKINLTEDILMDVLGIILESTDGVVHLIHQSAKEFILGKNVFATYAYCSALGPELYVAQACVSFLGFEDIMTDICICDGNEDFTAWEERYPFLDYAAWNWHFHILCESDAENLTEILSRILIPQVSTWRLCDLAIEIPERVLKYAASHGSLDIQRHVLARSKRHGGEELVMRGIMGNRNGRREAIMGHDFDGEITAEVVTDAVQNWVKGNELMKELATNCNARFSDKALEETASTNVLIDGETVDAAANNHLSGREVMGVFTDIQNVSITDEAVLQTLTRFDLDVLRVILEKDIVIAKIVDINNTAGPHYRSTNLEINEQIMEKIEFLLSKASADFSISEYLVMSAAGSPWNAAAIVNLLLSRQLDLGITEGIMTAAASNRWDSLPVVKHLLSRDSTYRTTEPVFQAAIENLGQMDRLLRDPTIEVEASQCPDTTSMTMRKVAVVWLLLLSYQSCDNFSPFRDSAIKSFNILRYFLPQDHNPWSLMDMTQLGPSSLRKGLNGGFNSRIMFSAHFNESECSPGRLINSFFPKSATVAQIARPLLLTGNDSGSTTSGGFPALAKPTIQIRMGSLGYSSPGLAGIQGSSGLSGNRIKDAKGLAFRTALTLPDDLISTLQCVATSHIPREPFTSKDGSIGALDQRNFWSLVDSLQEVKRSSNEELYARLRDLLKPLARFLFALLSTVAEGDELLPYFQKTIVSREDNCLSSSEEHHSCPKCKQSSGGSVGKDPAVVDGLKSCAANLFRSLLNVKIPPTYILWEVSGSVPQSNGAKWNS
ncbi:hypothetical protein K440DRAFT_636116 [Wilcoxina mikolae CBS 423.85]|nr:hypothetical protein K440DRAFT_636116 [Wilcoxina mikolae CBS 423.85]